MTFKQWLRHLEHWFYTVLSFPSPFNDDTHFWTGPVESNEEDCLICKAHRVLSDEELLDQELKAWQALSDEALEAFEDEIKTPPGKRVYEGILTLKRVNDEKEQS